MCFFIISPYLKPIYEEVQNHIKVLYIKVVDLSVLYYFCISEETLHMLNMLFYMKDIVNICKIDAKMHHAPQKTMYT